MYPYAVERSCTVGKQKTQSPRYPPCTRTSTVRRRRERKIYIWSSRLGLIQMDHRLGGERGPALYPDVCRSTAGQPFPQRGIVLMQSCTVGSKRYWSLNTHRGPGQAQSGGEGPSDLPQRVRAHLGNLLTQCVSAKLHSGIQKVPEPLTPHYVPATTGVRNRERPSASPQRPRAQLHKLYPKS
jgi:hypothetical protein